ncbi:hypothetical protein PSTG_09877 [Puccinia striiformis f. sp. tritici PST-78]|uniref:Uncharacterized protein n=2 Tax=Puccinia striiformis f. sp. tritici TaxID=168172 RepID=A0A0L0VC97_9BASI|nr:hypothetical protein PSTG_09877 [Puccinia striiformis f. sp. tritici PST-78]
MHKANFASDLVFIKTLEANRCDDHSLHCSAPNNYRRHSTIPDPAVTINKSYLMEKSTQVPASHRRNHSSIRLARHHASRQLASRPEIEAVPAEPSHATPNTVTAPLVARPPTPVAPSTTVATPASVVPPIPAVPSTSVVPPPSVAPVAEPRPAPSPPAIASQPVILPATTVTALPHPGTATPVARAASVVQATATSTIPSKTNLPLPPCSAGASCASLTAKSAAVASPVPQQSQGPQPFLASLSSSPGAIFFTVLVGIAIVGVMLAILSCVLRSWCNRRRRKNLDEDAWRFLENSKDFSDLPKEDEDELSAKSSHFRSDSQSNPAHLQPALAKNYVAPHPFPSHIQQQSQQAAAQYHFSGYPAQPPPPVNGFIDEQHMNGFIDDNGMCWVAPPVSVQSQFNGVVLGPYGTPQETVESYQRACTIPELVFRKTSLGGNFCNRATMYASPTQAPVSTITRPASVITRTSTTTSNQPNRLQSLKRELSIACSEQSTTVEALRERVTEERTDLRATLRGAIQKDKKADEDLLESLIILWHDKNKASHQDPAQLKTPELPPIDHILP